MTTDSDPGALGHGALIRLLHLASTMLPVGAFSYSQGLEWAVESGAIRDRADAERWIFDVLRWSVGRFEAPLLVAAYRAWIDSNDAEAVELDALMAATRESRELLAETVQLGYSLRRWCQDAGAVDSGWLARIECIENPSWPVMFAAVAAAWKINARAMVTTYLWAWLENQVSAAIRAVPLGHTDGQKILLAAAPVLDRVGDDAMALSLQPRENWSTQCPGLAIASSCHETQYSRLFRS